MALEAGPTSLASLQGYLDAAPLGVDAFSAHRVSGGDGAGVGFVDIERGWNFRHSALAQARVASLGCCSPHAHPQTHGTAVVGIVCGVDHDVGFRSIAPALRFAGLVSWYGSSVDRAILEAASYLSPGDVLLLEAEQRPRQGPLALPIETDQAVFDRIRQLVDRGVVVVEAAGNGAEDLDDYRDDAGRALLNRRSRDFQDSGAILVSAATSAVPHRRLGFANFGSRVDCYAWGENVLAPVIDYQDTCSRYTRYFGGTSGAAAIVAGVALCAQGIHVARHGRAARVERLRAMLGSSSAGTSTDNPEWDCIGVMPDLKRLIDVMMLAPLD